jgi:hypothetical protein
MKPRFSPIQITFVAFIFLLLIIGSCSKENSGNDNAQQEDQASLVSSESDVEAEMVFNEIFDDAMGPSDEVGMAGTGIFARAVNTSSGDVARPDTLPPCVTVTVTHINPPNVFPVRVVIDFGNTGCVCRDGRTRRGKIITEYTNRLLYPGAIATTTFDGFYIDSIHVEGTHKITNTSTPNVTPPPDRKFIVDVIDAKLTKPNGNYTSWSSHKTITQIEGLGTPAIPLDDVFKIEGSARGQVRRDNLLVAWESSIIDPLIKRFTCRWIVKGQVKTVRLASSVSTRWTAVLDFGNGNCDNQATITINGVTRQITLH